MATKEFIQNKRSASLRHSIRYCCSSFCNAKISVVYDDEQVSKRGSNLRWIIDGRPVSLLVGPMIHGFPLISSLACTSCYYCIVYTGSVLVSLSASKLRLRKDELNTGLGSTEYRSRPSCLLDR
jgi:hypothetical protein